MFYSQILLAKKGPLSNIWMAAHWEKKLKKIQIFQEDIPTCVENIVNPIIPLALRVSGHLLLGVTRIYSKKVSYLFSDCNDALVKIKMAFRPGIVDLPANAQDASNDTLNVQNFGEFETADMEMTYRIDNLTEPMISDWIAAPSQNLAKPQDITLAPVTSFSNYDELDEKYAEDDSFGDGTWSGFEKGQSDGSRISDIEQAREADISLLENINMLNNSKDNSFNLRGNRKESLESNLSIFEDNMNSEKINEDALYDINNNNFDDEFSFDDTNTMDNNLNNDSRLKLTPDKSRKSLDNALLDVGDNVQSLTPRKQISKIINNTVQRRAQILKKRKRKQFNIKPIQRDARSTLSSAFIKKSLTDTSDIVNGCNNNIPLSKKYKKAMEHCLYRYPGNNSFTYIISQDILAKNLQNRNPEELFTSPGYDGLSFELYELFKNSMKQAKNERFREYLDKYRDSNVSNVEEAEVARQDRNSFGNHSNDVLNTELAVDDNSHFSFDGQQENLPSPIRRGSATYIDMGSDLTGGDISIGTGLHQTSLDTRDNNVIDPADEYNFDENIVDIKQNNDTDVLNFSENLEDNTVEKDIASHNLFLNQNWHPHTIKTVEILEKAFKEQKTTSSGQTKVVTYNNLTKKISRRRTAAALFFELLQLKTLDVLEIKQDKPYNDILIEKTNKFTLMNASIQMN